MPTPARAAMTEPTDHRPAPPAPQTAPPADPPPVETVHPPAPKRAAAALRAAVADNLLVAVFGPVIVLLLLGYSLYTTNERFSEFNDDLIALKARIDAKFAAQDTRIDAGFNAQDARIDAKFAAQDARIDAKFAAQDARIDARLAAQDAKIDALDAKIDDIGLKLTALIAILGKTEEVDAAMTGELTAAATAPAPVEGPPSR